MIFSFMVSTPAGYLALNSEPYRLAGDTLNLEAVTHRKAEVTSPYVEGTFVVHSVRDNVILPLNIWVEGATYNDLREAVLTLCAAFDQPHFTVMATIDTRTELWNCVASDYSVSNQRELLHSLVARVDVQLVRHPSVEVM